MNFGIISQYFRTNRLRIRIGDNSQGWPPEQPPEAIGMPVPTFPASVAEQDLMIESIGESSRSAIQNSLLSMIRCRNSVTFDKEVGSF